jgi:hypothetical protein
MSGPYDTGRKHTTKIALALFLGVSGAAVAFVAIRTFDRITTPPKSSQAPPSPAWPAARDGLTQASIAAGTLRRAATVGDARAASIVLARGGISPDVRDRPGNTPLCLAAQYGHIDVMQILLQAGADPNARCAAAQTPLHFAAEGHHIAAVLELLARRADPRSRDSAGQTPRDRALALPGPILQQFAVYQILQLAEIAAPDQPKLPPPKSLPKAADRR